MSVRRSWRCPAWKTSCERCSRSCESEQQTSLPVFPGRSIDVSSLSCAHLIPIVSLPTRAYVQRMGPLLPPSYSALRRHRYHLREGCTTRLVRCSLLPVCGAVLHAVPLFCFFCQRPLGASVVVGAAGIASATRPRRTGAGVATATNAEGKEARPRETTKEGGRRGRARQNSPLLLP